MRDWEIIDQFEILSWYWLDVKLWWAEEILKFHKSKDIQYSVFHVPGVDWAIRMLNWNIKLSWWELKRLSFMWLFVWDSTSIVNVHPQVSDLIKDIIHKFDKIWLSLPYLGYTKWHMVNRRNSSTYWFYPGFFPDELIFEKKVSIKNTELLSDTYDFYSFLISNWLHWLLPEWTDFKENINWVIDFFNYYNFSSWESFLIRSWNSFSWFWEWNVYNEESIWVFIKQSKYFSERKRYFDPDWKIIENRIFTLWKKVNQWFIIQPNLDWKKVTASFFINDNNIYFVWESISKTLENWEKSKQNYEFPIWAREKIVPVLRKIKELWYTWPIWFDFVLNEENLTLYVLKAIPRFSQETTFFALQERIKHSVEVIFWVPEPLFWRTWNFEKWTFINSINKSLVFPISPNLKWETFRWIEIWVRK